MTSFFQSSKENATRKFLSIVVLTAFILSTFSQHNLFAATVNLPAVLPAPGTMIGLTKPYMPVSVKGLMVHPENPFRFDFLVDSGDTGVKGEALKTESLKLVKYFLAALTVPEKDMWVNLSPYEKDRVIPASFGDTELGRDVLAQDYILKQLTSSLTFPESAMGKKFWDKVYAKVQQKYGQANVPMNTFNKVWIMPSQARVYEHGNGAFVVESKLKVMLEADYLAVAKNGGQPGNMFKSEQQGTCPQAGCQANNVLNVKAYQGTDLTQSMLREVIIPALEKEVNEGAHFANLRQIFQTMILATWYKVRLKDSIIAKQYVDQAMTKGVDIQDKQANEKIYQQYLKAFKKGAYNYIKEDINVATKQVTPKKYISGGVLGVNRAMLGISQAMTAADARAVTARGDEAMVQVEVTTLLPVKAREDNASLEIRNQAMASETIDQLVGMNESGQEAAIAVLSREQLTALQASIPSATAMMPRAEQARIASYAPLQRLIQAALSRPETALDSRRGGPAALADEAMSQTATVDVGRLLIMGQGGQVEELEIMTQGQLEELWAELTQRVSAGEYSLAQDLLNLVVTRLQSTRAGNEFLNNQKTSSRTIGAESLNEINRLLAMDSQDRDRQLEAKTYSQLNALLDNVNVYIGKKIQLSVNRDITSVTTDATIYYAKLAEFRTQLISRLEELKRLESNLNDLRPSDVEAPDSAMSIDILNQLLADGEVEETLAGKSIAELIAIKRNIVLLLGNSLNRPQPDLSIPGSVDAQAYYGKLRTINLLIDKLLSANLGGLKSPQVLWEGYQQAENKIIYLKGLSNVEFSRLYIHLIDSQKTNEVRDAIEVFREFVANAAMTTVDTFIQQSPVSRLSANAIAVLGRVGERSSEAAKFIREQAIYMGAENIVIVGGLEGMTETQGQAGLIASENALIQQGLAEGKIRKTVDGNWWVKPNEADTARVINRTIVATRNEKDKGANNNWRDTEYVLNNVMPKFRNAFSTRKDKTLYVIPFLMEPEGANFGLPSFQLTDSLIVALQSISMARVGQPAWRALETTGRFHKGVHFSGDLDNLKRGGKDDTDDRWFVSMPDEEEGWTISYGSEYGGNVLFGKKFEGLRLAQWVAAKDLFGKMAEHMALIEVTHNRTGKKKYIAYVGASNQGKTNFATMKAEAAKEYGDQYTVKLVSDDLLKFRVTEDGKLTAFNPENGIFAVVSDTGEESNPNLWKMIGPNTGTIFSLMAYKEITEGEQAGQLELWWKGKTKQPPQEIAGWRDWTGRFIADRVPTQEDVDKVLNKDPKQAKKLLSELTSEELINVKRLMAPWEHPNGRATTKMSNAPNVSSEINNPKGVEIDAIIFGGRVPTPGFIPAIRQLNSFEQGLYSMMTMFTLTTAAEAGQIGLRMRDPGAMRPFFSLHEIDYFLNWIKVRRIIEEKGGKMPLLFQGNWFQQEGGKGRFLWPGFSENVRLVDWVFRMTDGEAKYVDTPIGRLPQIDDINVKGLNVSQDDLKSIFGFDPEIWKNEVLDSFKYLLSLADQKHPLPEEFIIVFDKNRRALNVNLPDREQKFTEAANQVNALLSSIEGINVMGVDRVLRDFALGREYADTIDQLNSYGLKDKNQIIKILTVYLKVVVSDEAQISEILRAVQKNLGASKYQPQFVGINGVRTMVLFRGKNDMNDVRAISQLISEIIDSADRFKNKGFRVQTGQVRWRSPEAPNGIEEFVIGVGLPSAPSSADLSTAEWTLFHEYFGPALRERVNQKLSSKATDAAMKGGIDLQAKNINLKIDADKAMKTQAPWDLKNVRIEGGLVPTIIGVQTKVDLPLLLGLKHDLPKKDDAQLSEHQPLGRPEWLTA